MIRISEGSYLQSYLLMTLCIHVLCIISSLCISTPTELGIEAIDYWFHRKRELISQRFTNDFIIESIKFLLKNNVLFYDHMYLYLLGTAMGTKCAPRMPV